MTFVFPLLNEPIRFSEEHVAILVVERADALRDLLIMLRAQVNGEKGTCVIAERGELRELSKYVSLVTDPFALELETKRMLTKVFHAACELHEAFAEPLYDLMDRVNALASQMSMSLEFDAAYTPVEQVDELIKLMGFHVDVEHLSFVEGIVEYMKLHRKFFSRKLFVFYNLKACLSVEELLALYRLIRYEKLHLLLIEDMQRKRLTEYEEETILDEDFCIL